jgi:hypothetical protein
MGHRAAMHVAAFLLLTVCLAACAASTGSSSGGSASSTGSSGSSEATGQIHIVATIAPTCPVERAGAPPCTAPYQGRIAILSAAGTPVTEVTTSSTGTADVSLPAGTYTLGRSSSASAFPRLSQPITITVVAGASVTATLAFDTGIR